MFQVISLVHVRPINSFSSSNVENKNAGGWILISWIAESAIAEKT